MQTARAVAMGLIGVTLGACADMPASPPKQDVEFVRGCWVEKDPADGRINAFLRLLPDGSDGPEYGGYLQFVRGTRPGPEIHISIARDGTYASVTQNGERTDVPAQSASNSAMQGDTRRLVFAGAAGGRSAQIEVAATTDRLTMTVINGVSLLRFDGARDGCD